MKQFQFFIVSLFALSTVSASAAERIFEKRVRRDELVEAKFVGNLKSRDAWVKVIISGELPPIPSRSPNDYPLSRTYSYVKRAKLPLTVDQSGNVIFNDKGTEVVCAIIMQKRFLGFKYYKTVPTGRCVLDANVVHEKRKATAVVDFSVR